MSKIVERLIIFLSALCGFGFFLSVTMTYFNYVTTTDITITNSFDFKAISVCNKIWYESIYGDSSDFYSDVFNVTINTKLN